MAVLATVLERNTTTSESGFDDYMTEDERHNAHIRENYARLIGLEYDKNTDSRDTYTEANKPTDEEKLIRSKTRQQLFDMQPVQTEQPAVQAQPQQTASQLPQQQVYNGQTIVKQPAEQSAYTQPVAQQTMVQQPVEHQQYVQQTVTDARADSPLFRADSPINRIQVTPDQVQMPTQIARTKDQSTAMAQPTGNANTDDENEDLRPTKTTIQYKSGGIDRTETSGNIHHYMNGKVSNVHSAHHSAMTRREKAVIGIVVGVILLLFSLVIINSAVISNLSSEMSTLQTNLEEAKTTYENADSLLQEAQDSLYDNVMKYVEENGGVPVED